MLSSILALSVTALTSLPHMAQAAVGAVAGADYSLSSEERTYRAVVVAVGSRWSRLGLATAATRYDDTWIGRGTAATAVVTGYANRHWGGRALGTRWWGDGTYRAWRLAAGAVYERPDGTSLFLYGARFTEESGFAATEAGLTAEAKIRDPWTWRGAASLSVAKDGGHGFRALTGFAVRPVPQIELGLEGGAARGIAGPEGALSGGRDTGGGPPGLGILSGPTGPDPETQAQASRTLEALFQVSFRVFFPG